ncbi:hypothetical protein BDV93DRAFT_542676 [Ceratobasidium sp. AG-I]|nr:hypothetical protein BDV93DRAFT_542676 [Ceratobasidium sp. AG-I]
MSYALAPSESPRLLHEPEAFQSNPSPSSLSRDAIELSPVDLGHTRSISQPHSNLSDHKSSAIQLPQLREATQRTPQGRLKRIARIIWLTAFMPVVAFAYLSFCYVVATRVVPVRIYKVDQPLEHLYGIKAGVTTISIIIVATALLPVKSLLDDLKGEEFFRRLHTSRIGVPLKFVNNVSTPSHSVFQGVLTVIRAQATRTILSGFIAAAATWLAPAALSVGIVPVEGELSAFRVGGIGKNSIYISSLDPMVISGRVESQATEAATMGLIHQAYETRRSTGVDMTFKPLSYKHAVPIPLDLEANVSARWISDVIVMDPVCTWTVPDPPLTVPPESWNTNLTYEIGLNISLPTHGVGARIVLSDIRELVIWLMGRGSTYARVLADDSQRTKLMGVLTLFNLTTNYPPTQGTMAWIVAQCTSCEAFWYADPSKIDFTGIPAQEFKYPSTFTGNITEETSLVSFLVCNPRATIESREVRADGSGRVEVVESKPLARQGNLHTLQTKLLLSRALFEYTLNSGPSTTYSGIGKAAQIQLFFGKVGNSTETKTLTPRPIDKLTEGYALAQQAAMRSYLSGEIASSYVPGRVQTLTLVFTSSLPHVITSTILFALLTLFINICYLRADAEQFTLLSVATALAHSDVPNVCEDMRYANQTQDPVHQDVVLKSLRGRRVYLANTAWATLPVRGPPALINTVKHIPSTDILLGTPPQNMSMVINISAQPLLALTPECEFCPPDGMYDPSYSSSASVNPSLETYGSWSLGGTRGNETVTLGGVLQDVSSPIGFDFEPRFGGGQLLNPVWGLHLARGNGSLTIGALDPNDYEGEINWVPALDDQPMIHVDAFKGYQGNVLPLDYPINATLDVWSKNIYLLDLEMYAMNRSYLGAEVREVHINIPSNMTFGVRCDEGQVPAVPFSVGINGVDYPIEQGDMVRTYDYYAEEGFCNVGVSKSLSDIPTLGLTFLRSVYFAYRFPTGSCPGYWGFAIPKGGATPTQKPKTIPSDAAQCLSFTTPTSTPSPSIVASSNLDKGAIVDASAEKFRVYGRPAEEPVVLMGTNDLPLLKALNRGTLILHYERSIISPLAEFAKSAWAYGSSSE